MKVKMEIKSGRTRLKSILMEKYKFNTNVLNKIGSKGVDSLAANTPIDTGELASGWQYAIDKDGKGISWFNTAHKDINVNLVHILHYGHYTRNRGYVPPTNFLDKPMDDIINEVNRLKVVGK